MTSRSDVALRALSLFSGVGGLDIGVGQVWNTRTVCYVENDPDCVFQLLRAFDAGYLDRAPVWSDIGTFDGSRWRGAVDLVLGGFPCLPFSSAARGRNNAIDLWPQMLRVVRQTLPALVIAENVKSDPVRRAASDCRALGYSARIICNNAGDVGAWHRRKRWWLLAADPYRDSKLSLALHAEVAESSPPEGADWWSQRLGVLDSLLEMDDGVSF